MPQVQSLSPSPTQTPPQPIHLPPSTPTTQPSSDPTAAWKTYRNEQYGFEMRYPPYYEVVQSDDKVVFFPKLTSAERELLRKEWVPFRAVATTYFYDPPPGDSVDRIDWHLASEIANKLDEIYSLPTEKKWR